MPFHLDPFVNFIARTSGRDKVMRTVQYFLRFVKFFALKRIKNPENSKFAKDIIPKLDKICSAFSQTRRLIRFGRLGEFTRYFLEEFRKLRTLITKGKNSDLKYDPSNNLLYLIMSSIGTFTDVWCFFFDHIGYLCAIKVINNDKIHDFSDRWSSIFWLIEIYCCIVGCFVDFFLAEKHRINLKKVIKEQFKNLEIRGGKSPRERKHEEMHDELEKMQQRKKAAVVELIKNVCDYPVCRYFVNEQSFTPLTVYFFGTWSSLIAWYQAWR